MEDNDREKTESQNSPPKKRGPNHTTDGKKIIGSSLDRVKVFDLIIPIVPFMDYKNSYDRLVELLANIKKNSNDEYNKDLGFPSTGQQTGVKNQLNDKFLFNIAKYISDMRLLKQIVNDFQIYYYKVVVNKRDDLDPNKLFAIMIFKNLFPYEFDSFNRKPKFLYSQNKNDDSEQNTSSVNLYETKVYDEVFVHLSKFSPIIKFLVDNKYIDKDYESYISIFSSDSITPKDSYFIDLVRNHEREIEIEYDNYIPDNPDKLIKLYFTPNDYKSPTLVYSRSILFNILALPDHEFDTLAQDKNIIHKNIAETLQTPLWQNSHWFNRFLVLMKEVIKFDKNSSIKITTVSSEDLDPAILIYNLVKLMSLYWTIDFFTISENQTFVGNDKGLELFLQALLSYAPKLQNFPIVNGSSEGKKNIIGKNEENILALTELIGQHPKILDSKIRDDLDLHTLSTNLINLEVKFHSVSTNKNGLWKFVYENNLYKPNYYNIKTLAKNFHNQQIINNLLDYYYNNQDAIISKYIHENFESVIESYTESCERLDDSVESVIKFIKYREKKYYEEQIIESTSSVDQNLNPEPAVWIEKYFEKWSITNKNLIPNILEIKLIDENKSIDRYILWQNALKREILVPNTTNILNLFKANIDGWKILLKEIDIESLEQLNNKIFVEILTPVEMEEFKKSLVTIPSFEGEEEILFKIFANLEPKIENLQTFLNIPTTTMYYYTNAQISTPPIERIKILVNSRIIHFSENNKRFIQQYYKDLDLLFVYVNKDNTEKPESPFTFENIANFYITGLKYLKNEQIEDLFKFIESRITDKKIVLSKIFRQKGTEVRKDFGCLDKILTELNVSAKIKLSEYVSKNGYKYWRVRNSSIK